MLFNSMGAPDFFSHKSERELKLDKGEMIDDSDDDDDVDWDLTDADDESSNSILSKTQTPFSSRTKNQFTPNAESLRDPLKGRHATGSSVCDFTAPFADVEIEATGMLKLRETFDVTDLYHQLHRAKRSETMLNILSCQFSPQKDFLAIALSTGEIEVLEYDANKEDLRICYTLMDRDVNGESINCTNISWLPDGKKLLSTYTNGYLKMWHVVSKKAVLTRDENEVTQPANVTNNPDIVAVVFKSSSSKKDAVASNKREVLCVSYSRITTVNMEEHINQSTSHLLKKQRLETIPETSDRSTLNKRVCDHQYQVTLVATGGSDGVIIVWILTDSFFLSKDSNSLSAPSKGGGGGSQLVFHRCCVHGGRKKSMDGHMMKVFAIRFLPREPKRFLSGGWDGLIFKWDAISGECLMSCKSPVMCSNESMDLDTSVERPLVVCGDHGAGFLDVINYKYDDEFVVDTRILLPTDRFVMPYVCSFFGSDKIIVGGSNPNCIRIIDRKVNVDKQPGQTAPGVKINKQGEATIVGSLDNLPSAVSCVTLGKEDGQRRQQIVVCSGSLIVILSATLRH